MKIPIHREGRKIILGVTGFIVVIVLLINYLNPHQSTIHFVIYSILFLWLLFTLRFFRNPHRKVDLKDKRIVVSPADGKVVDISETFEQEYFQDTRMKISIFMSPANVHKNWYPVSGTIRFYRHHPGKFLVAWHPKSSDLNERTTVVISTNPGKEIMVRQIAGAVAQRISCYAKESLTVKQGEELGFIKFGSRVDVILPMDAEILVTLHQKVIGCTTPIARL